MVWKVLWGEKIRESVAINNDYQSTAPGNNEFISGAGVAEQAVMWMLHDAIKASSLVELWPLQQMVINREAGDQ